MLAEMHLRWPLKIFFYGTLQVIGVRANMMVDEIYEDLQNHIKLVRSIPSDHRSSLAKQVQALYDICRMGGVICSRSRECVDMIQQAAWSISFAVGSNEKKRAFASH